MGFTRIITYPFVQVGRGLRNQIELNARSRQLGYFYDIANRLAKAYALPATIDGQPAYQLLGNNLARETASRGVSLRGAALAGFEADIQAAITAAWPPGFAVPRLAPEILAQSRIVEHKSWLGIYDRFVPLKSARALDQLIAGEQGADRTGAELKSRMVELQATQEQLMAQARDKVKYLNLGHQAYLEIMSAIYQTSSNQTLIENITEMFDVVTRWAYQVIGRSAHSESAGWVVQSPDGKIGVPYRFVLALEGQPLDKANVLTLRRSGSAHELSLAMEETQTTANVADQRGNFIAVEEWENLQLREELVVVEKADGSRRLFRRELRPGSQMVKHLVRGMLGDGVGKVAGAFAGALTDVVGKLKSYENAYVELKEVELSEVDLKEGTILPLVQEGTIIKIVSAGSNNPNLREEKIAKGLKIEEACRKGGLQIGIINQRLESAVGNIRTSALKPVALMIKDVDQFAVRAQNRFLISIVGVESYFIRSLMEVNERGEVVCLGALEVTNPEVIPAKLSREEEQRLIGQFEAGRIFASLASTGIMIKVLQEELNEMTRSYLGEKVYRVVKGRDYEKLRGQRIDDATIMFADVSGFTALSDILKDQPEKVVYMLSKLFSRLDPIVVRNGGMVDKHDGDCIMADFGVPDRTPGDVRGAVEAAIDLMRELEAINQLPEMQVIYDGYKIKPLGMTIGLNTGMVIAGNLGHAGSKIEFSVIGDAVNVAARLQHAVVRGQVMIGATTLKALSAEDREALAAKLRTTVGELFIPSVILAKNKGAVPCYYVNWDGKRSLAASFEETRAEIRKESDPEQQGLMLRAFEQLLREG